MKNQRPPEKQYPIDDRYVTEEQLVDRAHHMAKCDVLFDPPRARTFTNALAHLEGNLTFYGFDLASARS